MTSYISVENQTMLWSTIQKIQLLHETIPTNQQQDWFKNILGMFYQQNINIKYDIRQLNKETISYMINSLKQNTERQTERQFVDRQQDYIKKEIPQSPNFKEPLDDGVIENMDELLKQQMKQRELDMPVDGNIRRDIDELQKTVKLLQDEITELKKYRVEESSPT